MVGVSVGLGEWQELESPHERDEPNLFILLMAPVVFWHAPFILATRANKNEREQLDSGYVSEMKTKLLPEYCSSKCVNNLVAKKWERDFLAIKLEPKSNENPRAKCERVWEGVSEWELSVRAQHPSLGLYLKREWPGTVGRSWAQRLVAVGECWQWAVERWGRPTQWFSRPNPGPTGWQPGPRCSQW